MTKQKPQAQAPQNLMKYYWIGFIGVLIIIGVIALIMSSGGEESISADDSDAPPAIPFDDESIEVGDSNSNELLTIPSEGNINAGINDDVVNNWRIYSSRLFYDDGGGGSVQDASAASTTKLVIMSGGRWEFGSSSGTWSISEITNPDWQEWGISSYGPSRKITLNNWKSANNYASGPIEETDAGIDFLWVIYRVDPSSRTVSKPGQVQTKFGH